MTARILWLVAKIIAFTALWVSLPVYKKVAEQGTDSWTAFCLWTTIMVLSFIMLFLGTTPRPLGQKELRHQLGKQIGKKLRRMVRENAPDAGSPCTLQYLPCTTFHVVFTMSAEYSDGQLLTMMVGASAKFGTKFFYVEEGALGLSDNPMPTPFKVKVWNHEGKNCIAFVP